jgi:hypothetical protein
MAESKGIHWLDNAFVVGTRADLAPTPLPHPIFTHQCTHCGATTLTETEYPHDIPIICNVCASDVRRQLEEDSSTQLLYTMPNDVKVRLIDLAHQRRLPVEEVFKDFLDWKLERPTHAHQSTKSGKKTKE